MTDREVVQIAIQLDVEESQVSLSALIDTLDTLKVSLEAISQWNVGGLITDLQRLTQSVSNLSAQLTTQVNNGGLEEMNSITAEILSAFLSIDGMEN